jgi:hypothetical protein
MEMVLNQLTYRLMLSNMNEEQNSKFFMNYSFEQCVSICTLAEPTKLKIRTMTLIDPHFETKPQTEIQKETQNLNRL